MASSGWEDMTEADARRLGKQPTKRHDILSMPSTNDQHHSVEMITPKRGHKYRAIPCIVTADLTLFVESDIAALEAKPRSTIGVGNPKLPLRERANSVGIIGDWFGSTKEAKCWIDLKRREVAGEIMDLQRQVPFELMCPTPGDDAEVCRYVADFTFRDVVRGRPMQLHVVDAKGQRTAMYKLKAKWLKLQSGITIEEV